MCKGIVPRADELVEPLKDEVRWVQQIEERPTQESMDNFGLWRIGMKI